MEHFAKIAGLAFIFIQALSVGCSSGPAGISNAPANVGNAANVNAANAATDSIEELRSLVRIPFEPEDITWRILTSTQGKRRLVAVFLLTPEAYKAFSSKYTSAGPGADVKVSVEPWFPAELTAMSEMTGDATVAGKAYAATEFFQDPFASGNIVLIPETNYAVLDVHAN